MFIHHFHNPLWKGNTYLWVMVSCQEGPLEKASCRFKWDDRALKDRDVDYLANLPSIGVWNAPKEACCIFIDLSITCLELYCDRLMRRKLTRLVQRGRWSSQLEDARSFSVRTYEEVNGETDLRYDTFSLCVLRRKHVREAPWSIILTRFTA